jgi:hypothetical protein
MDEWPTVAISVCDPLAMATPTFHKDLKTVESSETASPHVRK